MKYNCRKKMFDWKVNKCIFIPYNSKKIKNPTNIKNVNVCENGYLFHSHAITTERFWMKLYSNIARNRITV